MFYTIIIGMTRNLCFNKTNCFVSSVVLDYLMISLPCNLLVWGAELLKMMNLEDYGSGIGDKPLIIAPDFVWKVSRKSRKIWKKKIVKWIIRGGGYRLHNLCVTQSSLPLKCRLGVFNVQNTKGIFGPRTEEITDAGGNFKMFILISVSFTKYCPTKMA